MKHRVFRYFIDVEKEEAWINKLAAQGMHMISFGFPGFYTFEEGLPGEYRYRIELLENLPSNPESIAYIRFLEESGVEHLDSHFRWIWLRKKTIEGSFDLYSDCLSRLKYYRRLAALIGVAFGVNVAAALFNLLLGLTTLGGNGISLVNLYVSFFSGLVALLFLPLTIRYTGKIKQLKKEILIHE